MKSPKPDFAHALRAAGFKATPGRLNLLQLLWAESKPLPILEIGKRLTGKLNEVTLYRALEAFAHAGLVRRVDLQHDHAHYELLLGKTHHHHVVCTSCSKVEDVESCEVAHAEPVALKVSGFKSIYSHNLEFFGLCQKCAK